MDTERTADGEYQFMPPSTKTSLVIPAKAGIQDYGHELDSGVRRNDESGGMACRAKVAEDDNTMHLGLSPRWFATALCVVEQRRAQRGTSARTV